MTKDEIKTLIDTKIAGQGTNVDGGGALATILNAILEQSEPLRVKDTLLETNEGISEAVFLELAGISLEQLIEAAAITDGNSTLYCTYKSKTPGFPEVSIRFGDTSDRMGEELEVVRDYEQKISIYYYEV